MKEEKIVVFIGYKWETSKDLRAFLVLALRALKNIEVLVDIEAIMPGQKIHEKISAAIDRSDFYMTSIECLTSLEVTNEIVTAHERGKKILILNKNKQGALAAFPQHLPFLHDNLQLVFKELDELEFKLGEFFRGKSKSDFYQPIYSVNSLKKEVSAIERLQVHKSVLLTRIFHELLSEVKEIRSKKYSLNLGFEKNYLFRSSAIFSTAKAVWAVSVDTVSTFWSGEETISIAENYIDIQPDNTHRLFVFSTPKKANIYKKILQRNFNSYGETGGVYICSAESYENLIDQLVNGGKKIRTDFAILQYEQGYYIQAILDSSKLEFQEIDIEEPGIVRYPEFINIFEEFRELEYGRIYDGSFSSPDRPIIVKKWNPRCIENQELWEEELNSLFPIKVSGDICHLLFFKDKEKDGGLKNAIQVVKNSIYRRKRDFFVESIWFGQNTEDKEFYDFGHKGKIKIQSDFDFLIIVKFANPDHLRSYYENSHHSEMRIDFYKKLDPAIAILLSVANQQNDVRKEVMYDQAIELLVSKYMVRYDFIEEGGVESIIREEPIDFNYSPSFTKHDSDGK